MVIRRNRTPSVGSRMLTSSLSVSSAVGDPDTSPSTGSRFRKKYSVPARPFDSSAFGGIGSAGGGVDSTEDIDQRRRRIRRINQSVPPLPVPSIYRGYLPRYNNNTSSGSSSYELTSKKDDYSSSSLRTSPSSWKSSSHLDNGITVVKISKRHW